VNKLLQLSYSLNQSEQNARDSVNRWSKKATENSNALDLEPGVFSLDDLRLIAESSKRSSELSKRCKGTPYHSAMSMLNYYIDRAGKNLPVERRETLKQAKIELKKSFHK
jgi:hypothetical protein